ASDVLEIALAEASGLLASARSDDDEAVTHLERAVGLQDALRYMEPPPWHRSTRVVLGSVLLDAGRAVDAEREFRDDLDRSPGNGWALLGLAQSLEEQWRRISPPGTRSRRCPRTTTGPGLRSRP